MKIQVRFHYRVFENCLYKILDKIMTSHRSRLYVQLFLTEIAILKRDQIYPIRFKQN